MRGILLLIQEAQGDILLKNAPKTIGPRNYIKANGSPDGKTGPFPITIFVGDQLFTDVYGAKRTGIRNILVKPIHPKEEIQIVFKRKLEKIVLYFYEKEKRKQKNG